MTYRLPSGGHVDRSKPLGFSFDGKRYSGFAGDTLASALIANGVHLVGRSFKYHRPRGFLSAGSDEPNALVGVGGSEARYTPNLRATQVELYDGLVAESQNRWPSLSLDLGAVNDLFSRFLTAGFYYKTFMWPAAAWKTLYEPMIRRAAGLGRAPAAADADRYTQVYRHCDVLIVGAGPAGLAAALAAGRSGASTVVCDEQDRMGGTLLSEREAMIDGVPAADWLTRTLEELRSLPNVTLLPRTTAFGWYPHNFLGLCQRVTDHLGPIDTRLPRERMLQVRAREVVLAAGAIERPLVFPDNDRPGIMMAEAARTYLNRYAAIPGKTAVVFTACDSAYRAAVELKAAGVEVAVIAFPGAEQAVVIVEVAVIADIRSVPQGPWVERARGAGIEVRPSTTVAATYGRLHVSHVDLKDDMRGVTQAVPCDLLLMSGGFTPSVHLFSQSRGKLAYDETLKAYVPKDSVERERSVGACRGVFDLGASIADGFGGGLDAVKRAGGKPAPEQTFAVVAQSPGQDGIIGIPNAAAKSRRRAWVDFQNDVTAKDIELATREGFRSIEHVKRYTTTGMATDQGKTSNMNALGVVSQVLDLPVSKVGLTTFRPPFTPVTFGAFAGQSRGQLFDPVRRTSIHGWAAGNGAVFEDVSLWKRARYFPRGGEDMDAAVRRECAAVRKSVGMFDATTLGKIEVVGRDAAEFMNRTYTNAWTKLEPGRLRYGVMLREDGFVMDDGVVGRMAPDRFHVTTTTGGACPRGHGGLPPDRMVRSRRLADVDDRAMGGHRRSGPERPKGARTAGARHRPVAGGHAAHERPRGAHLRGPHPSVQGVVHGRTRFRSECPDGIRARGVGSDPRGGESLRDHALRDRNDACASRGEGIHHRRSGDGRHRHAGRCRALLGGRQGQEGFRRETIPRPSGDDARRPEATRRPADH